MVVNIGGKEQTVHVKNGKSVVDISDLGLGKHDVKVDYPDDGKHDPTSNSTTITVLKIDDYPIGENNTDDELVISVPEDATGSVVVNMDGKNYIVPIKDASNIANKITVRSWDYFSTIFLINLGIFFYIFHSTIPISHT